MLVRGLMVLICLGGIQTVCQATDPEFDASQKFKIDSVQLTESETLQFGPFSLLGRDVNVGLQHPDRKVISVKGNARLVCGQTRFSANQIKVSYKTPQNLSVDLSGDIEIENERDQLRIFARNASLRTGTYGRSVALHARDRESVTLLRTSHGQTTEILASQIYLRLSDLHTLEIVAIEKAKIKKRSAQSTDRVNVDNTVPSELDFFDGISITDCQISTAKDLQTWRQREIEVEQLQLLK